MTTSVEKIYVLELKHGCYYVGVTKDPDLRFQQHVNGKGAVWTKAHPPIQCVELLNVTSPFDEDNVTKLYMNTYGIDKVRGGSYVQLTLDKSTEEFINKELQTMRNECFNCGQKGHYITKCPYEKKNKSIGETPAVKKEVKPAGQCSRCGRTNHTIERCYAKTHISGDNIVDENLSPSTKEEIKPTGQCSRCGRLSRTIEKCYAKTHIDGHDIVEESSSSGSESSESSESSEQIKNDEILCYIPDEVEKYYFKSGVNNNPVEEFFGPPIEPPVCLKESPPFIFIANTCPKVGSRITDWFGRTSPRDPECSICNIL